MYIVFYLQYQHSLLGTVLVCLVV